MDSVELELFEALESSVCSNSTVEFVVAFGSRITGEATSTSDLDIAVMFVADLSASDRFEKRCFLSGDLQREDVPFVDVSDIEAHSLDVAHDAVNGTVVCGDERAFDQFGAAVESRFTDQQESRRRR